MTENLKKLFDKDYEENKEPSNEFITTFAEVYGLSIPNDVFFDASSLFELF